MYVGLVTGFVHIMIIFVMIILGIIFLMLLPVILFSGFTLGTIGFFDWIRWKKHRNTYTPAQDRQQQEEAIWQQQQGNEAENDSEFFMEEITGDRNGFF
jgi:hypothetical protein